MRPRAVRRVATDSPALRPPCARPAPATDRRPALNPRADTGRTTADTRTDVTSLCFKWIFLLARDVL